MSDIIKRSCADRLYGWLGQNKKGIPTYLYEYNLENNEFICTTSILSLSLRVSASGINKKIAREESARLAIIEVEKIMNCSLGDIIGSPSSSNESTVFLNNCEKQSTSGKAAVEHIHGRGLDLMLVNNFLYNYKMKPSFECEEYEGTFKGSLTIKVRSINLDETFVCNGETAQIAKYNCGQEAVAYLKEHNLIPKATSTFSDSKSNSTIVFNKKRTGNMSPMKVAITRTADDVLCHYLLLSKLRPEVISGSASISEPVQLLRDSTILKNSTIQYDKEFVWGGPDTNWNPWKSQEIVDGIWRDLSWKAANDTIQKFERQHKANKKNDTLPIFEKKNDIVDTVRNNQIVIIKGGTGSGKSTQVVQFLFEDYLNDGRGAEFSAYITQPRKIAAIALAKRVASERGEKLGTSVGYSVRLDHVFPRPYGSMVFCTIGILLRKLQKGLKGISHLIIDEIHERSLQTDFLLILVKMLIQNKANLRVILMSASMDSEQFSSYLNNCPIITVAGNAYPVKTYFIEDILKRMKIEDQYNLVPLEEEEHVDKNIIHLPLHETLYLIKELLCNILSKKVTGSILTFLPGWYEIAQLKDILESNEMIREIADIYPLHSSLTREEQSRVFLKSAKTKIILSTNIAESSITIDDISHVIDSCRHKEAYHCQNVTQLDIAWISKSNMIQRRGRAGRVKAGICFHLCTKDHFEVLRDNPIPEIKRLSLDELILHIKMLGIGEPHDVLEMALDPPDLESLKSAEDNLKQLGAIDGNNNITKLGQVLSRLPVSPAMGKAIILGTILGVGSLTIELIAMISVGSPYSSTQSEIEAKSYFSFNRVSDHAILVAILQSYLLNKAVDPVSADNFLQSFSIKVPVVALAAKVKTQIIDTLRHCNFPSELFNDISIKGESSEMYIDILTAVLTPSLYPNICYLKSKKKGITLDGTHAIFLHSGVQTETPALVLYTEKIVSRTTICKESSTISPIFLLLYASKSVECIGQDLILLDKFLHITMDQIAASNVAALRPHVENLINRTCEICEQKGVLTDEEYLLIDVLRELSIYPTC